VVDVVAIAVADASGALVAAVALPGAEVELVVVVVDDDDWSLPFEQPVAIAAAITANATSANAFDCMVFLLSRRDGTHFPFPSRGDGSSAPPLRRRPS
jgi:hypothetical protein